MVLIEAWITTEKFNINITKGNAKFCLSSHYNADSSYFLLMEKKY